MQNNTNRTVEEAELSRIMAAANQARAQEMRRLAVAVRAGIVNLFATRATATAAVTQG